MSPDFAGAGSLTPLVAELPDTVLLASPEHLPALLEAVTVTGAAAGAMTGALLGTLGTTGATAGAGIGSLAGLPLPVGPGPQNLPALDSVVTADVAPAAYTVELAQSSGSGAQSGQDLFERLQEMQQQQQMPTRLPESVTETAALVSTGPMPPYWFMFMLVVLGLVWAGGMLASRWLAAPSLEPILTSDPTDRPSNQPRVQLPEHDGRMTFRYTFSAGVALWVFVLSLGTLLSSEVAGIQLWLFYMPVMAAMIGAISWCGLSALESRKRGQVLRSVAKLENEIAAGLHGDPQADPATAQRIEALSRSAEQGKY